MDEVLHALWIKGRASEQELALALGAELSAIEERLRELDAGGFIIERAGGRRPGWMLSPAGREAHAAESRESVSEEERARLLPEYKAFLKVNSDAKQLCTVWQTTTDDQRRAEVLAELDAIREQIEPVLTRCGEVVGRFGRYNMRLAGALEMARTDPRYVVNPAVDSFHTVWFECHEDFLDTLGLARHEQASW